MKINRNKIREILKSSRMYEYDLAERLGITRQTYWRRCKLGLWNNEQILRLQFALVEMTGCDTIEVTYENPTKSKGIG
jgi:hypothetical protein